VSKSAFMGKSLPRGSSIQDGVEPMNKNVVDRLHRTCYPKTSKKQFPITSLG